MKRQQQQQQQHRQLLSEKFAQSLCECRFLSRVEGRG